MEVKSAVRIAKNYVNELFADEGIVNLGLEEVEHSDAVGAWLVTLGFSRPWNTVRNAFTAVSGEAATRRAYRVVTVADDGQVASVKRRDGNTAD